MAFVANDQAVFFDDLFCLRLCGLGIFRHERLKRRDVDNSSHSVFSAADLPDDVPLAFAGPARRRKRGPVRVLDGQKLLKFA